MKSPEKMIEILKLRLANEQQVLEKFQKRLVDDPLDAFIWSQDVVLSAANVSVLKRIIFFIESDKKSDDQKFNQIVEFLNREIKRHALYPPSSTSHTSNLAETSRAQACAQLLEVFE